MSQLLENLNKNFITAKEATSILGCSRGSFERLQLLGKVTPVPTIYPKYYFKKSQVIEFKKRRTQKTNL
jgi:hypothetical protein